MFLTNQKILTFAKHTSLPPKKLHCFGFFNAGLIFFTLLTNFSRPKFLAGMPYPKCDTTGSAKASGGEPKTGLARVFYFKLGCFDDVPVLFYVNARPHL
jgi:hypothetical protein